MIIVLSPSGEYDYYIYNSFNTKEEAVNFLENENDYLANYKIFEAKELKLTLNERNNDDRQNNN